MLVARLWSGHDFLTIWTWRKFGICMFPSTLDSFSPFCCLLFFNRAGLYVEDHLMCIACSAAKSSRSPERLVQTMLSALSYLLHSVGGYRDPQWTAVSPSLQIVLELLSHLRLIAGTSPFTGPACSCTNPADLLVISLTSGISASVLASYHIRTFLNDPRRVKTWSILVCV